MAARGQGYGGGLGRPEPAASGALLGPGQATWGCRRLIGAEEPRRAGQGSASMNGAICLPGLGEVLVYADHFRLKPLGDRFEPLATNAI